MGETRNTDCVVKFSDSSVDVSIAESLGIDLNKAMLGVAAVSKSRVGCPEMTHAVVAKDEETYDWVVSLAEKNGLPVPMQMVMDAQQRQNARANNLPAGGSRTGGSGAGGVGTFSACCSMSNDVTVILIGDIEAAGKVPSVRYVVSQGRTVRVTTDSGVLGPSGVPKIQAAEITTTKV